MAEHMNRLKELLACYGSNVQAWPHDQQDIGHEALGKPECKALIEEEERFEQLLRERRPQPAPHDLAQRIIAASLIRPKQAVWFMREILAEVRPAAWAAMLVLGFAIGFSMTAQETHNPHLFAMQSISDEDGAILMNSNVKTTLIISIVLNVLLAGMILGDVSHHLMPPPAFDSGSLLLRLPAAKRTLLETTLNPARQRMDRERAAIAEAKKEALRILQAPDFDPLAYITQSRRIENQVVQMKQQMAETIANLAKQFSPTEREILAEIISHPPYTLSAVPVLLQKQVR